MGGVILDGNAPPAEEHALGRGRSAASTRRRDHRLVLKDDLGVTVDARHLRRGKTLAIGDAMEFPRGRRWMGAGDWVQGPACNRLSVR
jgi:hypothetical protein